MGSSSRLLAEQRQSLLLARLRENGTVRTADLAADLKVASITIRRDLVELQEQGIVVVMHGGARLASGRVPPADRRERAGVEVDAKRAIGRAAAGMVHDGDVVFLDSGTTCAAVVPSIATLQGLTVVTNDLTTASDLVATAPQVRVVMAGGVVDAHTLSTVGELLPAVLASFMFDIAFFSASAWDRTAGATTGDMIYAAAKRMVLDRARTTYLLADSSKYGASEAHVVQRLRDFDGVICDAALTAADQDALRAAGVNLTVTGS
jgi:DeoR/GlpR family transcriptional regulator of sugar metabolism